jgi:hypothetical protein
MAGNKRRKIEGVGLSIVGDEDVWQGGGVGTEMAGLELDRAHGEGGELRRSGVVKSEVVALGGLRLKPRRSCGGGHGEAGSRWSEESGEAATREWPT